MGKGDLLKAEEGFKLVLEEKIKLFRENNL